MAARNSKDISDDAKKTLSQLENLGNVVNELYKKIATIEVIDKPCSIPYSANPIIADVSWDSPGAS